MNLRGNVLSKVPKLCENEKVDSRIFDPRAAPHGDPNARKDKQKIKEGYIELIGRIPFHIIEDFYDHGKGYPKEVEEKMRKNIETCFEGSFRNYLRDVKEKYPKKVWKIKKER